MTVAVCLPCYRFGVTMEGPAPLDNSFPERHCYFCGQRTNQGIELEPEAVNVVALLENGVRVREEMR